MKPTEPLALHHSWPLDEWPARFDLGVVHEEGAQLPPIAAPLPDPAGMAGTWVCDLSNDALTWSPAVYQLFGFREGERVTREASVARYAESSRVAMERLRRHAIRHRRGFTLDVQIAPVDGGERWIRLHAAPICAGKRVIGLHGHKREISYLYRSR